MRSDVWSLLTDETSENMAEYEEGRASFMTLLIRFELCSIALLKKLNVLTAVSLILNACILETRSIEPLPSIASLIISFHHKLDIQIFPFSTLPPLHYIVLERLYLAT